MASVELVNVSKHFGDFVAVDDVSLEIGDGEFFSLLGPSGCGKTTTLRMIAGFEQPTIGQIYIGDQPVAGVPAYRRPVNTVFQNYALFPHMTVAENVAFGLQMARVSKGEIAERVAAALDRVHMEAFAERKPDQLSGGQKQRIALARALVNRPRVLLLDEPLGALDLKLRKAMQLELKHIQSDVGITFIYVTHDQEEAMTMSDRIAVMQDGVIQQVGASRDIYEHPANRFVADFIGETNFLEGVVTEAGTRTSLESSGVPFQGTAARALPVGAKATLAVRPEKIRLRSRDAGVADNGRVALDGHITEVIYIGTDTRYEVAVATGDRLVVRVQNLGQEQSLQWQQYEPVAVEWAVADAQVLAE